jgi:hypothetical protein
MNKLNRSVPKNLGKKLTQSILENLSVQATVDAKKAQPAKVEVSEKLDGITKHAKPIQGNKVKQELAQGKELKSRFSKVSTHPKLKHTHEGEKHKLDSSEETKGLHIDGFRKALEEKYGKEKVDAMSDDDVYALEPQGQRYRSLDNKRLSKSTSLRNRPERKDAIETKAPLKGSKESQNARISWMNDIVNAAESIKGLGKSAPGEWTREKLSKKTNRELWQLRGEAQRQINDINFKNKGTAKVSVPAAKATLMKGATSATHENFEGAGRTRLTVKERIALRKAALEARQTPRLENSESKKVTAATNVSRQKPRLK